MEISHHLQEEDGWHSIGGHNMNSGTAVGDFVRYVNQDGKILYGIIRKTILKNNSVNRAIGIEFQDGIKDWISKQNANTKYKSLQLFDSDNADLSPAFVKATQDMIQKFILKNILLEDRKDANVFNKEKD